jgi:biopolymer transport protein ExbB
MRSITLFAASLCFFSSAFSSAQDAEMLDLEQELLALEDDLLESTVAIPEEAYSEEPSIIFEAEKIAEPLVIETPEKVPFIHLQESDPILPSEEQTLAGKEESPSVFWEETSAEEEALPVEIAAEEETPALSLPAAETISFKQVFAGSPLIYSVLLSMSLCSITISLYSLFRMQHQSAASELLAREIRHRLLSNNFQGASDLCQTTPGLLSRIMLSALSYRKHGLPAMVENMKSEGKRATLSSWQRLGILQDIAIIAPMLGLLGTVMGLFYAFYDLNRSFDSMNQLLDGLGVSVGTTVAGIGVAILSMILHSVAKFKLVRCLAKVETEATVLVNLIDENS